MRSREQFEKDVRRRIQRVIRVDLGTRSYQVLIGGGLLAESGEILRAAGLKGKALIVTNPKVGKEYLSVLRDSLAAAGFTVGSVEIPDGEEYKSLAQVERVYEAAVEMRLERSSTILTLGGGVIGDLAGFAAATYLRGLKFVQVPTTLLAQVDSSIGGKVAVNHQEGKNLIGAFYQPQVVLADLQTLRTLEQRDFLAGMAEVIKVGLIKDQRLYTLLVKEAAAIKAQNQEALAEIIAAACSIKAEIVSTDELETGIREILNYGHTIGHALEAETRYQVYRHGEAVSVGMRGAARLATLMGICDFEVLRATTELLKEYALPIGFAQLSRERLLQRMALDKKVTGNTLRFVLPVEIGQVVTVESPPADLLSVALDFLGARSEESV